MKTFIIAALLAVSSAAVADDGDDWWMESKDPDYLKVRYHVNSDCPVDTAKLGSIVRAELALARLKDYPKENTDWILEPHLDIYMTCVATGFTDHYAAMLTANWRTEFATLWLDGKHSSQPLAVKIDDTAQIVAGEWSFIRDTVRELLRAELVRYIEANLEETS